MTVSSVQGSPWVQGKDRFNFESTTRGFLHDLRAPIRNAEQLCRFMNEEAQELLNDTSAAVENSSANPGPATELLKKVNEFLSQAIEYTSKIMKSSMAGTGLVGKFKNFLLQGRLENNVEKLQLNDYLSGLESHYSEECNEDGLKLVWKNETPRSSSFNFDPSYISRLLDNLISNARRELREKPQLSRDINVTVSYSKGTRDIEKPKLHFQISNETTLGKEEAEKIFDLGFTSKTGRDRDHMAGTGLSNCQHICDSFAGQLKHVLKSGDPNNSLEMNLILSEQFAEQQAAPDTGKGSHYTDWL